MHFIITYSWEKQYIFYSFQIDQQKAFNKVDTEFLKFQKNLFLSLIFFTTSAIITSVEMPPLVSIYRGLWQEWPLSLPLYLVKGEVTRKNINKNNNIKQITIPNTRKQWKLSQYPDESNFFPKYILWIETVLLCFANLKEPLEQHQT